MISVSPSSFAVRPTTPPLRLSVPNLFEGLDACATTLRDLHHGRQIHAQLAKFGVLGEESVFVNTKLILMYGKCGELGSAQDVFDRMPKRSVFAWNAIIGAYLENDDPLGSLRLYRELQVSGSSPDPCTFSLALKACGMLNDVLSGTEIHGYIIKRGFANAVFVVNALVAMYAKFDDLGAARRIFHTSEVEKDVVTWNSIISAYSGCGRATEALQFLRELQVSGLIPNTYTTVAALKACENEDYGKLGRELHAFILKSSAEVNLELYVGNALIAMYARCGRMDEASSVFSSLGARDHVSWNSMLSGFVLNCMYNEAFCFFRRMQNAGPELDEVSALSILSACGCSGNLLLGMEAHAFVIRRGLDHNLLVGNSLLDMYAKCCHEKQLGRVFGGMPEKDNISWTTVVAGYAQNDCHLTVLQCFREAQVDNIMVDNMMMGSILLACSGLKCTYLVKEVHCFLLRRRLFDLRLENQMVTAYGACGCVDHASRVFQIIDNKDTVSWTSIMTCYRNNGLALEAFAVFNEMMESGVEADDVTLLCALSAVASLSLLKKGKEIHGLLVRKGMLEGSIPSALIHMYSCCGDLEKAKEVFSSFDKMDLVLSTAMIQAYAMHGCGIEAIDLFNRMEDNIVPDHISFLAVLYACSHSGLVDEGTNMFKSMQSKFHLEPWPEHYACVVDLLGRANRFEEAYEFIKSIPGEPTAEVWCALVGACRVHSNKKFEELAICKLLNLTPKNPGNYVLVSNTFAARGQWEEVEELRQHMKERGLRKIPGCSWIDIGNKIHSFVARDKSHPELDQIYQKLTEVTMKLVRDGGYVPQTKFVLHNVKEEEKLDMLYGHSERLAIAYGLLEDPNGSPIRVTKNLRVCGDCHEFCKLVSKVFGRELIIRDANRYHHFREGGCSCGEFW
ncbi:hypothetical protein MLD38_026437 [Melastoma candidum]|uniref:Uncharacterized protein n=1 Tax=Melastoma candidum TaxID=119954 RepID=A0ACB9NZM4_9MYRT|nr:hypothetical protein MLD38_026437 [Melastoma candidum]